MLTVKEDKKNWALSFKHVTHPEHLADNAYSIQTENGLKIVILPPLMLTKVAVLPPLVYIKIVILPPSGTCYSTI
jgi:hypothetical protein